MEKVRVSDDTQTLVDALKGLEMWRSNLYEYVQKRFGIKEADSVMEDYVDDSFNCLNEDVLRLMATCMKENLLMSKHNEL